MKTLSLLRNNNKNKRHYKDFSLPNDDSSHEQSHVNTETFISDKTYRAE